MSAHLVAVKRSLELNPRDTDSMAFIGILIGYLGDWEEGIALTDRAIALNPHGPGWYWLGRSFYHYHKGEYPQGLNCTKQVDMPDYHSYWSCLAVNHAELGQTREASDCIKRFHKVWPGSLEGYKLHVRLWFQSVPEFVERFEASLGKARLELP